MKTRLSIQLREDSNTRVAAYESMLDLFTLITFVLIIAALMYATRVSGQGQNWSSVVTGIVEKGSGVPRTFPENALTIMVYRENSKDMLTFVDGQNPVPDRRQVTKADVFGLLDGFASVFDHVRVVNVVVHNGTEDANGDIYLKVTSWLAIHNHNFNFFAE
ncbi:MAG TPA: hypothetical protein VH597_09605 [Verrucomicrobiae bacterium]|jgi:hypothetical protein|nr:hypothetical protein [Verrucomicrobiae bacterium]